MTTLKRPIERLANCRPETSAAFCEWSEARSVAGIAGLWKPSCPLSRNPTAKALGSFCTFCGNPIKFAESK